MKRISVLCLALVLWSGRPGLAQDNATEERFSQMNGRIEDLIASQESIRKQITELARELRALRDEQGKPNSNNASQEDLHRIADAVKEVDRKRLEDAEKVRAEFVRLQKLLSVPPKRSTPETTSDRPKTSEKGYEYVIQKGDTLSVICAAYKEQGIKITTDQILKANPGLKAERLTVGQKIFIPSPAP